MIDGRPRVAITIGDPNGVGPEIVIKALSSESVYACAIPVVVGDVDILERAAAESPIPLLVRSLKAPEEANGKLGVIDVVHTKGMEEPVQPGTCRAAAGRAAYAYIHRAVDLTLAGRVHAIVTGPISKEALFAAGYRYPGHTELLVELTSAVDSAMMLVHQAFRVAHVTTHARLRDACNLVTRARVRRVIELTHEALVDLETPDSRIGVAALNPHAGEGGLFGPEEDAEIRPAVEDSRGAGIDVHGPIPADTIFPKLRAGQFDAVVAMYHDQGHIPVKLLSFELGPQPSVAGVNLTLGLPIIRTSVEHGVAFDIAGKWVASPRSLHDALLLAAQIALHKARKTGASSTSHATLCS